MAVKNLLAAALVSALPFAGNAQTPTPPAEPAAPVAATPAPAKPAVAVTIYGTLNVNLQTTRAHDATNGAQDVDFREAVSTDSSNIGFRGSVELSPWLGATFQCETSINVDGINVSGLCNRNSRVGITGAKWGTLWYGNWDTPFKASAYGTKAEDPFGNTDVFAYQGIMGSPGFNYRSGGWKTGTATAIQGFDVRANNSVGYHSAKWNGLSAKAQYSVREFADAQAEVEPQLYGATVNYDMGPASVYATFEKHDDGFGLSAMNNGAGGTFGSTAPNAAPTTAAPIASTDDIAWRVGAGYELASPAGATTVSGAFEQIQFEQGGPVALGAVEEYKRWAFQVGLKHRIGNHELRGRYSFADEGDCDLEGGGACSTDEYGAQMYTLGYAYHMSKSLQTYVFYTQILNDDAAQYTFSIGGAPAVAGSTPAGADPQAMGLGIRYAF